MEQEALPAPSFTIFSNVAITGWAEGFAALLREGLPATVEIAETLHDAIDAETDVLVLNLHMRFDERLPEEWIARLRRRRVIAAGSTVNWLRRHVNELEPTTGFTARDRPMVVADCELLGNAEPKTPFRAFKTSQDVPTPEWNEATPVVHVGSPRLRDYEPEVDYIATQVEEKDSATVIRQGSVVHAGVHAHPDEFSAEYRTLMRRVALALAQRPVEPPTPIVVQRQIHPPGTIRLDLPRLDVNHRSHRTFHLRFERPTAFTATLEHTGSNAMMLLFMGDTGPQRLHWTRVDSETGKTLTIATDIRQPAIDALGHRYWEVQVANFDQEHDATATLTMRYNVSDSDTPLLPLASGDGFETLNWRANALFEAARTGKNDALERFRHIAPAVEPAHVDREMARAVVAREHGFNDWGTLSAHVAWELPNTLPAVLARGARMWFERGLARYPDSFSAAQLAELAGGFPEPAASMLSTAFTQAKERGHQHFTTEHLLEALINNPMSKHVLHSAGCNIDALRPDLDALLEALPTATFDGETQVSEPFCNATYRAEFIPALGREGMNPGSLLTGLMGVDCAAQKLLARQGIRQQGFVNYVSHGIPTAPAPPAADGASVLHPQLESDVHEAFVQARNHRHQFLTTEHLLPSLLHHKDVAAALHRIGVNTNALARDIAQYTTDATPRAAADRHDPEPTRAFNEVMQTALAMARQTGRHQATPLDALRAISRESELPANHLLRQHGANSDSLRELPTLT